jgi:predicted dienelactone hydrolase
MSHKAEVNVCAHTGLESLRGRLDLNNVSLIGHSFGGATCLQVSATLCIRNWIRAVQSRHIRTAES